ncbi:MAG: DUF3305 domain-containing protein [Rhodocyclaceae bacterium]|nr:DUF3305 domain-containing protein [Rhodocyclaceae bacterium]
MPDVQTLAPSPTPDTRDSWALRLHLQRRSIGNALWTCESWSLLAVDSDRDRTDPRRPTRTALRRDPDSGDEIHVWDGLGLTLHRDERAAYRFNLSSRTPRLFVHCEADDGGTMVPTLVTASQDVAAAYMDGGDEDVFSCPMPSAVQCWIEAFIARHGEPEIALGKSRRRQRGKRHKDADDHG